jgi:DNA-binding transcriptional ArsR family regulator
MSAKPESRGGYAFVLARIDTATVARLFADRSRIAMLDVLMDGDDHPVGVLARAAGIAPSTAIGHVGRLEEGGLVHTRRDGRQRLVRLAGPAVAASYEALATLSCETTVNGLRASTRRGQLALARTCYDHLAGRVGVALADAALAAGALTTDFSLGSQAPAWFERLGVDVDTLSPGRRPLIRVCIDWTERREHLAGALGAAMCSAVLDAGWLVRRPSSRALSVTLLGEAELGRLGVDTGVSAG